MGRNRKDMRRNKVSVLFSVIAIVLLAAGIGATKLFWGWLHPDEPTDVSNSETLRNVGLLIGGALAFVFAGWRAWVAERQANAAQAQVDTAQDQAATAQQTLLNEQYQRSAEMLGDDGLSVRMGGIYALGRLAEEHPVDYHLQVMQLLCAFVRNPTNFKAPVSVSQALLYEDVPRLRDDIQAAVTAIGTRSQIGRQLEWDNAFTLDLNGSYLVSADMRGAAFERADLRKTTLAYGDLGGAGLSRVTLTDADMQYAELSGAKLEYCDMVNVRLYGAIAQYTNFSGANLTGSVLVEADLRGSDFSEARCFGIALNDADISGTDFRRQSEKGSTDSSVVSNIYTGPTNQQLEQARWDLEDPPLRSAFIVG